MNTLLSDFLATHHLFLPYRYAYLMGSLFFLILWLILYLFLPRYRQPMLLISLLLVWIGPFQEYFLWTRDWWHPQTITHTRISIEDFILTFSQIGLAAFLPKLTLKKTVSVIRIRKEHLVNGIRRSFDVLIVLLVPAFILSYIFHIHSFISTSLGFFLAGCLMLARKPLLFASMARAAVIMIIVTWPVYYIGSIVSPGVVEVFWDFSGISGIILFGAPIEDLIWYAFFGFFFGGIYDYLFTSKINSQ